MERLLDVDHHLASVGVGLRRRRAPSHRPQLPAGLKHLEERPHVERRDRQAHVLHHVVGLHRTLARLGARLGAPPALGHAQSYPLQEIRNASRAFVSLS
jgi:hypothetical protein